MLFVVIVISINAKCKLIHWHLRIYEYMVPERVGGHIVLFLLKKFFLCLSSAFLVFELAMEWLWDLSSELISQLL